MGGAQVILTTAPSAKPMTALFGGLGPRSKMVVVGATMDPLEVAPGQFDSGQQGHSGMGVGDSYGFRGHLAVCGDDWRASDDRKVSAGEGERGVGEDGEQQGAISRGANHVGGDVGLKTRGAVAWRLDFTLNAAG
jgi:hypothetical protein